MCDGLRLPWCSPVCVLCCSLRGSFKSAAPQNAPNENEPVNTTPPVVAQQPALNGLSIDERALATDYQDVRARTSVFQRDWSSSPPGRDSLDSEIAELGRQIDELSKRIARSTLRRAFVYRFGNAGFGRTSYTEEENATMRKISFIESYHVAAVSLASIPQLAEKAERDAASSRSDYCAPIERTKSATGRLSRRGYGLPYGHEGEMMGGYGGADMRAEGGYGAVPIHAARGNWSIAGRRRETQVSATRSKKRCANVERRNSTRGWPRTRRKSKSSKKKSASFAPGSTCAEKSRTRLSTIVCSRFCASPGIGLGIRRDGRG